MGENNWRDARLDADRLAGKIMDHDKNGPGFALLGSSLYAPSVDAEVSRPAATQPLVLPCPSTPNAPDGPDPRLNRRAGLPPAVMEDINKEVHRHRGGGL